MQSIRSGQSGANKLKLLNAAKWNQNCEMHVNDAGLVRVCTPLTNLIKLSNKLIIYCSK